MKKAFTFALALLATMSAWAQTTFTVDNLKYTVTDETAKTVRLSGYVTKPEGTLDIPATVTNSGTEYSVTSIGNWTFVDCYALTQVTLPESLTTIGEGAFGGCIFLEQITFSKSITSIGESAFSDCYELTQVTIPTNTTNIGEWAFGYCDKLTTINVEESNTSYTSINGILFNKDKSALIQYPIGRPDNSYNIPDGTISIGAGAFASCNTLTQITIPNSVKDIGFLAFQSCKFTQVIIPCNVVNFGWAFSESKISEVIISEGVKTINEGAFLTCERLTKIIIPNSVASIEDEAFSGCRSLAQIIMLATIPPTVEANTFEYLTVSDILVYVPAESLEDYKKAEIWKEFNLQAMPATALQTPSMPESISVYGGMLHNPQGLPVSLYDMQGRMVYSGTAATVSQPAGVYVLRCSGASSKVLF